MFFEKESLNDLIKRLKAGDFYGKNPLMGSQSSIDQDSQKKSQTKNNNYRLTVLPDIDSQT